MAPWKTHFLHWHSSVNFYTFSNPDHRHSNRSPAPHSITNVDIKSIKLQTINSRSIQAYQKIFKAAFGSLEWMWFLSKSFQRTKSISIFARCCPNWISVTNIQNLSPPHQPTYIKNSMFSSIFTLGCFPSLEVYTKFFLNSVLDLSTGVEGVRYKRGHVPHSIWFLTGYLIGCSQTHNFFCF